MNSTTEDKTQPSGVSKKDNQIPSTSRNNQDNNANLSMATSDESRGAIPKTKPSKITPKKSNNNLDESSPSLNGTLKRNSYPRESNYLNYTLSGSESELDLSPPKSKEFHSRSSIDFKRTPLNIPLETDFLGGAFVPCASLKDYAPAVLGGCYRNQIEDSGESSSDDNELLSVSDDGCIYTYKGDQVADLPSSFFHIDIPPLEEINNGEVRENSSPEMDFLEMDFDPGPSGDADSDSISNAEIDNAACLPLDSKPPEPPVVETKSSPLKDLNQEPPPPQDPVFHQVKYLNLAKIIPDSISKPTIKTDIPKPSTSSFKRSNNGDMSPTNNETIINGDITLANLTSFHNVTRKHVIEDKNSVCSDVEKVMIWSDQEACLKQLSQVGPAGCGVTAVINVLNALRLPVPPLDKVQECVNTRTKSNSSSLSEYLQSQSKIGCNHRDLIKGLYKISDKQVYCRFFATHPERIVDLPKWLAYWIKNGAVPIATLNLQKSDDSWYHQMVYGVGPKGIYLTNPLECVDPGQFWSQLTSESAVLVRSDDVITRWNRRTDIPELMKISDVRWRKFNVLGQVAKVVRESRREARVDYVFTSHVKIPSECKAGITLCVRMDTPACNLLHQCPELPEFQPEDEASAL